MSNEYKSSGWTTYNHSWKIKEGKDVVSIDASNSNSISVKGKKAGRAKITDTITWNSFWDGQQEETITYTIHVSEAVAPTAITISGADKVTQFKDINLTYTLTPAGAEGTVQWSSSNEDILTVDSSGKVTGLRRGQATVTANVYSGQSLLCSATKTIQVVEDTTVAGDSAIVYYLLDPTKDANSNASGNWGPAYGTAKVNVTGATWTGGKNCFDNVDQRVVSWPNGTNVVTRDSTAWNQIFNKYKSSVEEQLGVPITEDDVVSITLRPAKISRNNYSTPDLHLDCNVDVNCKRVSIVHYYLLDKSSDPNSTEYVHQGSKSYINGNKTNPETVTGKSFPRTKTGTDGATYTFSGWYTDQELTQPATFPYTVNSNVNFYAKYVAGRQVVYNLDGGSFSDGSSLTEKHNEGENVVVKSEPTRKGYKFTGWTVEGLDGVSSIDSGASFQMPNNNVTITANWEEQKIEDFITLTPTDVTEVYNGEAHAAGIATASAKKAEANLDGVKIEYQKADGTWTENPAEITATNVADSTTVKVRVTSENYTGKLEDTEELTITKRPITITGSGWTSSQPYTGKAYTKTDYEVEQADAENTRGLVAGETATVSYEITGTNVGSYTGTFGNDFTVMKDGVDVTANYTVAKTPGTLTITKAEIAKYVTLTPTDVTKVYDGNAYAAGTATAADTNGNDLKIEYQKANGSWTEDPTEITATEVKDSVTVNVRVSSEGNYDGYVTGTEKLTITKRPITITGSGWTSSQPYTGKAYTKTDYEVEQADAENTRGLVAGETATVSYEITGTNVGLYTGTFGDDLEIKTAGGILGIGAKNVTDNYTVTKTPGTLTISKAEINQYVTLNPRDVEEVYDGTAHEAGVATATDSNGNELQIEYSVDGTNWTTDPGTITATEVKDSVTVNVRVSSEGNYDGYVTGTEKLTITKRPIEITGDGWTSSQPYTGKAYTKTDYEVEQANAENTRGLVAGETATVSYEIAGTNVGTYAGTFGNDFKVMKGDVDVTANYNPTKTPGTLTITKAEIAKYVTLTPTDVTKVYDGNAYAAGTATAADTNGNDLKIEYQKANGSWTEDPTEITATEVKDSVTVNVRVSSEGNYDGYVTGTEKLTITKRPITITGSGWTSSQPYTGKAYTKTDYEVEQADAENTRGLVAGETATVSYEITGTNVGLYTGTFGDDLEIKTAGGILGIGAKNVTDNYTVTKTPGTLTISKAEINQYVTLNPRDVEEVYDGTAHEAGVATATDSNGNELQIEYSVDGTNWTTDPGTITATEVKDSVTVNVRVSSEGNYDGYVTGTEKLTITKRPIEITGDGWTSSQPYTGKAYTKTDYEVEQANAENTRGLVAGETATVSYEIAGTNVGTYAGTFGNDFKVMKGDVDVTANYNPTKTPGTLTITKAEIAKYVTLTPTDVTKVYDGNAYAAGTATAADTNGNDLKIEYQKANGSWTEDPTEITATEVKDSVTVNVRVSSEGNYDGYVTGTEKLTITKRPITITGSGWTSSQPYTGKAYTKTDYEVEQADAENTRGLVAGETATVSYEITGTNVGLYTGTFGDDLEIKTAGGILGIGAKNVTDNYTVTKTPGTLTISKAEINQYVTLNPRDVEEVYDGTAHEAGVATATDSNGNELQIEYSVDGTNWTTDPGTITATEVKDSVTVNVRVSSEGNYDGYVTGTEKLTITKRPIEITGDGWTSSQPYTGKAYTKTDYEVEQANAENTRGLVAGETATVSYEIAGTNVGTYAGTFGNDFKVMKGDVDVTANYNPTKTPGTLTITKAEIAKYVTLTPTDVTKVYDGNAYAAGTATAADTNGNDLKIEYQKANGSWTEDPTEITATEVKDSVTVNVRVSSEGNYDGYVTGTEKLTITKRPITITGSGWTSSQPYTGKAYTKTDYEVEQADAENTRGLVAGETATVSYEITGTNVGLYTGTFGDDLEIKTAGGILGIGAKNVTDNYTVTKTPGTLTISKAEINQYVTLNPRDVEEVYDGTAHEAGVATATDSNGNELQIEYSVDGTNWTTDPGTITATEVKDSVTVNVRVSSEGNYDGYVTGTEKLTITKRPITITGSGWDADQVYTGKEYKKTEYTVEEANVENTRGLVAGETATVSYEIKGANVGPYTGTFEDNFLVKKGNKDVTSNYEPVKEEGTLRIVTQSINPGPNPENPDPSYDGIQIDSPSDVEYDGLDHQWSPAVTDKNGNALTAGTDYEVSYDTKDFKDVKTITVTITGKGNYTGTVTRVYNIFAAPLIIRTEKAEKTYDGKPLTNENMTIEGLKNREVVAHKTTGTQTEVGNSDNTYELDWESKETTAKESNYIIKEVSLGKLVVKETEDEIVVTTTGGTFTYDGQPHGATVEVSELPEGYTLQTAESDATATDVTTEAVTADADRLVIVNAAGVDVTANLKITRVTGEIVVNPATVTVTTPNASKVYDGTPLTAAGTITGLVNGETVSFATTGTITNVGTATNSYSLVWDQTAKATNYKISENLGTLTVTAPANNNPSNTPTPPATPNPPATPSDNPGVLDRVVDTIKDVAADVQEVFSSDDGDVPLANQNLDEHKCCILHFLIMLLTAILYGFFTHNMKKRQKKNFELREELDTELVKRGLPTSKEQKNS